MSLQSRERLKRLFDEVLNKLRSKPVNQDILLTKTEKDKSVKSNHYTQEWHWH